MNGQEVLRSAVTHAEVTRVAMRAAPARWTRLWVAALLAILGFLVIYPVLTLLLGALTDTNPVVDGFSLSHLSIANFLAVLVNPNVAEALFNTLLACGGGTLIAVAIGLAFSWIVVRTNTPFKGFIAAASMLPLFAPPLVAGVAWTILGSPKTGLINTMFKWAGLDLHVELLFAVGAGVRVRHLLRALRLHVHLFGAAQHGSEPGGGRRNFRRQRVRDAVLGDLPADHAGDRLRHAAVVHRDARHLRHPGGAGRADQYQRADDLYLQAHQLVAAALQYRGRGRDPADGRDGLLVFLQQKVLSGRSYTTVAGKAFRPRNLDLGPWRWLTFGLGVVYLLVVVILPSLALIVAAFRKFMFIRDAASLFDMRQYSLMHFYSIFDNPLTMNSIYNALEVGIITAAVGGTLAFAIGYTIHRTNVRGPAQHRSGTTCRWRFPAS